MNADGVDFAGASTWLHLREWNLDEFDFARVAAVLVDPGHRHQMDDVIKRVDRDGLAFEILGAFHWRDLCHYDRVGLVAAAHVGGAAGDELEIETFACA